VKKSVDAAFDDHPDDGDRPPVAWSIAITDDCDDCADLRVEVTFEEKGAVGHGVTAHLSPAGARNLRAALAVALRDLGEPIA